MTFLTRVTRNLFPNVVAPAPLKGLSPSWSGIFMRLVYPIRNVDHPVYGKYSVIRLSRDEYRRLEAHDHREMIDQYPGRHTEVNVVDYKPGEEYMKARAERINTLAKSKEQ